MSLKRCEIDWGKMLKKNYNISFVRLIALFMVILVHALSQWDNMSNNLLVIILQSGPVLYIIISAVLMTEARYVNPLLTIKHKAYRILKPYYIWVLSVFIVYYAMETNISIWNVRAMLFLAQNNSVYNQYVLPGFGHLWYIPFILGCYLLTPIFNWIWKGVSNLTSRQFFCFLMGFCLVFYWIGYNWNFLGFVSMIPYYMTYGASFLLWKYYKNSENCFIEENNCITKIILVGVICATVIYIYLVRVKSVNLTGTCFVWFYKAFWGIFLFDILYQAGEYIKKWDIVKRILNISDTYNYEAYLVHKTWLSGGMAIGILKISWSAKIMIFILEMCVSTVILHKLTGVTICKRRDRK